MIKITFSLICFISLLFSSCEKQRNEPVLVIRDCSGTYLRFEGKDYQVCNTEKTDKFAGGTAVTATFKRTDKCNNPDFEAAICFLLHVNEGFIEVTKIKQSGREKIPNYTDGCPFK